MVVFGHRPMARRWLAFAALAYVLMGGGQMAFTVEGFAHSRLLLDDRRPCRSGTGPSGGTSVRKEGICRRAATVLLGKSVGAGGGDEDVGGGKRGGRSKFEGNGGVERQGRSSRPASKGGSNSGQRTSSPLLGFNDGVISEDGTPPTNPLMRRVWEIQKLKAESGRKKNAGEARKASKMQQQAAMPEKRGGSDTSLREEKVLGASKQGKGKARDGDMSLDAELSELQAVALTLLTSSEVLDEDVDMTPTIEGIRRIKGDIFAKTANWPKTKAEASNTAKDGGELDDEMRDIIDKAIDILKENDGELDHLTFGKKWKAKHPEFDLKPVCKRKHGTYGTVARLLNMSPQIEIRNQFSNGRKWRGVRVFTLVSEQEVDDFLLVARDAEESDLETVMLPGESLNEGIARVYAELVEETMMLNKAMERVKKVEASLGDFNSDSEKDR